MTPQELKTALMTKVPVIYDGIKYKNVSGIIYRKGERVILLQAELWDNHSVTIANPLNVELVEPIEEDTMTEVTELEKAIAFFKEHAEVTEKLQSSQNIFYAMALKVLLKEQAKAMYEYEKN